MRIITFFSLLLSLISLPAQAQQWYHTEVLVFEHLANVSDEQAPRMPLVGKPPLNPDSKTNRLQPASNTDLNGIASRLNNSGGYRVITHESWQQPFTSKNSAPAVGLGSQSLAGSVRFFRGTYLHADLDLWFRGANNQTPQRETGEPRRPHLSESRRIRSEEIHYFDHPDFGVLIRIKPVETPSAVVSDMLEPETYSLPKDATAAGSS